MHHSARSQILLANDDLCLITCLLIRGLPYFAVLTSTEALPEPHICPPARGFHWKLQLLFQAVVVDLSHSSYFGMRLAGMEGEAVGFKDGEKTPRVLSSKHGPSASQDNPCVLCGCRSPQTWCV